MDNPTWAQKVCVLGFVITSLLESILYWGGWPSAVVQRISIMWAIFGVGYLITCHIDSRLEVK